jgi:hypothetical protein
MTRKVLIGWAANGALLKMCSGRDLNPQAFRHTPLKRTCLPFHHPSVERGEFSADDSDWQVSFLFLPIPFSSSYRNALQNEVSTIRD